MLDTLGLADLELPSDPIEVGHRENGRVGELHVGVVTWEPIFRKGGDLNNEGLF